MPLTRKQQRFIAEYLVDSNATQAARRAGYSARTASSQGERLLRHRLIAKAVRARQDAALTKLEITAERVLQEIATVGFANPGDWVGLRYYDKVRALELLAKRFGLLKEKIEISFGGELAERLARARQRVP
jgi:phage terminase small subunit